jgi:hypothetical protein
MRLNAILVCGEGNSYGSYSTLLPPPADRRDEDKGYICAGIYLSLENGLL